MNMGVRTVWDNHVGTRSNLLAGKPEVSGSIFYYKVSPFKALQGLTGASQGLAGVYTTFKTLYGPSGC